MQIEIFNYLTANYSIKEQIALTAIKNRFKSGFKVYLFSSYLFSSIYLTIAPTVLSSLAVSSGT